MLIIDDCLINLYSFGLNDCVHSTDGILHHISSHADSVMKVLCHWHFVLLMNLLRLVKIGKHVEIYIYAPTCKFINLLIVLWS